MYIYTHFQTVAILKKIYIAFCFLIYNIYIDIYMETSIGKVKPKWNNTRTVIQL